MAVDDGGAGFGMAALALPQLLAQGIVYLRPDAGLAPSAIVVKDDAIRRQVVRQQTPGGAGTQDVEDGVDDFPAGIFDGASAGLGGGNRGSSSRHSSSVRSLG